VKTPDDLICYARKKALHGISLMDNLSVPQNISKLTNNLMIVNYIKSILGWIHQLEPPLWAAIFNCHAGLVQKVGYYHVTTLILSLRNPLSGILASDHDIVVEIMSFIICVYNQHNQHEMLSLLSSNTILWNQMLPIIHFNKSL
jgi:hypothetical protein